MSYYNQQPSSYPGSNEHSSYPGGGGGGSGFPSADTRGAIGYPGQGDPSNYPGQGGGYTSGPDYGSNQSSYPGAGGPGYGNNSQGQYGGSPDYGASSQSYYNGAQSGPGYQSPQGGGQEQQVQYDENGNPLPPGERGIGTMALGAVGGEQKISSQTDVSTC